MLTSIFDAVIAAVGHPSDQRTLSRQTPPLRLGRAGRAPLVCLHEFFEGWAGVARGTVRALTVVQCDQTPFSATSMMFLVKKQDGRCRASSSSLSQVRCKMVTVLIVLVVLLLLGGGGWGYSRWRA